MRLWRGCLQNSALNPLSVTDPSDVKLTKVFKDTRTVGGKDEPLYLPITLSVFVAMFTKSNDSSVLKSVNRMQSG